MDAAIVDRAGFPFWRMEDFSAARVAACTHSAIAGAGAAVRSAYAYIGSGRLQVLRMPCLDHMDRMLGQTGCLFDVFSRIKLSAGYRIRKPDLEVQILAFECTATDQTPISIRE